MSRLTLNDDEKLLAIAIETVLYRSRKQQVIRFLSDDECETTKNIVDQIMNLASRYKAITEEIVDQPIH